MTALFRMAIALFFQSAAYLIRCVMFVILGLIRPIDYLADALQRVALWLAIDDQVLKNTFAIKDRIDDQRSDNE